jgi:tetratricopeptide (TPR) repeat protein
VAKALEELDADRLDERAALLAHHWEQASEPLVAARWMVRAARGAGGNEPAASSRLWRAARDLLARSGEGAEAAQLELEACRGLLGLAAWFPGADADEVAAAFARGLELAELGGDRRTSCHLHLHFAIWRGMVRNDTSACARHAEEAARLAELVGDEGAALAAAAGLAIVGYVEGRVPDAIAIGRRAVPRLPDDLTLGSGYFVVTPAVWLMALTRFLEGWSGRPAHGLAGLESLVETAGNGSTENVWHEAVLRLWATHLAELLGDAPSAMASARRQHDLSRSLGGIALASGAHYCLGIAHAIEGDAAEAVRYLERAAALHQEGGGGPPVELLTLSSRLGVAYAEIGESERALDAAARGLALVRALRMPVFIAIALLKQAEVLRKTRGAEARESIAAALAEAEALVESTGIRGWQPFLHVERGELAGLLEDEKGREPELREAQRLFTAMGAVGHAERVAKALGS